MKRDIEEILFDEDTIKGKIKELAAKIQEDYKDKDLMMEMDIIMEMNFIRVSSYGAGTKSSGNVRVLYDLETNIVGKDVLIVEDIIDSGNTLYALREIFLSRGARTVKSCCLLDKVERREANIMPDYVGFIVPDKFLVGYGLDFAGKYRNLKYVGVLKPEIYSV